MKYIIFSLKSLKITLRSTIISFILISVTMLMFNSLVVLGEDFTNLSSAFSNMDDVILLSFSHPKYVPDDLYKCNSNIKNYHKICSNLTDIDHTMCASIYYDEYLLQHFNLDLKNGRRINDKNEIIITSTLGEKYKVGDTVTVMYYTEYQEQKFTEKKVCGILSNDTVFYSSSFGSDISALELRENLSDPNRSIIGNQAGCGFITSDDCFEHPFASNRSIIFIEPGLSDEKSISDLCSDLQTFGCVYKGEEFIKDTKSKENRNIKDYRSIMVALAILSSITLFGHYMLDVYRRRNEFAVMYICGATNKNIYTIEIIKIIALVSGASIVGISLAYLLIKEILYLTLSPVGITLSCAFMLVYILFSMLALYLVTKKEDVSEIMKGE
ncbi:MAG: hypothetical protein IKH75_21615 [Ruminococcus sp.]|nr:hypothetical protein [Ruminococcus sp.]